MQPVREGSRSAEPVTEACQPEQLANRPVTQNGTRAENTEGGGSASYTCEMDSDPSSSDSADGKEVVASPAAAATDAVDTAETISMRARGFCSQFRKIVAGLEPTWAPQKLVPVQAGGSRTDYNTSQTAVQPPESRERLESAFGTGRLERMA